MSAFFEPAQTNLQLYRQAHAAGWADDEIAELCLVYRTAALLLADRLRYNGKPSLCHMVGLASALIADDQPKRLARAALLHAAYEQGRFSDGSGGPSSRHRSWLRARVGDDIEDIVFRYTNYRVSNEMLAAIDAAEIEKMTPSIRELVVMRVCNEVDDSFDYAGAVEGDHGFRSGERRMRIIFLARLLGLSNSATALDALASAIAAGDWFAPVGNDRIEAHPPAPFNYARSWFRRLLRR